MEPVCDGYIRRAGVDPPDFGANCRVARRRGTKPKHRDSGDTVASRDHHTALRSDVVERVNAGRVAVALVKLQSGKDDVAFTLHVNPTSSRPPASRRANGCNCSGSRRTPVASSPAVFNASAKKCRKDTTFRTSRRRSTTGSPASSRRTAISRPADSGHRSADSYRTALGRTASRCPATVTWSSTARP